MHCFVSREFGKPSKKILIQASYLNFSKTENLNWSTPFDTWNKAIEKNILAHFCLLECFSLGPEHPLQIEECK